MISRQKISPFIFLAVLVLTGYPLSSVLAQPQAPLYQRPIAPTDLPTMIGSVVYMAWVIFVAIGIICFLVAGVLFLTSQGQAEKLKTARAAVLWGVAGIAVGILAFSIRIIITANL